MNEQLIACAIKNTQDAVDVAIRALVKQWRCNARQRGFNVVAGLLIFACLSSVSDLSAQLCRQDKKIKELEAKIKGEGTDEKKGA